MKIRSEELVLNEQELFESDLLDRKVSAEQLTQLLSTISHPFVLSISSPFGSGKSWFVKMWKQMLEKQGDGGYHCVYFNAWEQDYSSDPLISFIGEIRNALDEIYEDVSPLKDKLGNIYQFAGSLARRGLPVLAKALVKTYLAKILGESPEELKKLIASSELEAGLSDLSEDLIKEEVEKYKKERDSVKGFRKALEEVADEIRNKTGKPLVFFVDELDRCRPAMR